MLATSWLCSLQFWFLFDGDARVAAFLMIDIALAAAFFVMSRGRWFPAPLFFLHALLIIHHLYMLAINQSPFWMHAFLNRAFEVALLYVAFCAIFRILRTTAPN